MQAPGAYDAPLWRQMSGELGWSGLAIPEQYGGGGLGWVELCILQEELGRRLVASPFFATVALAASLVREAGSEAQREDTAAAHRGRQRAHRLCPGRQDGRPPPEGVSVRSSSRGPAA